jgi:hypothetical protein
MTAPHQRTSVQSVLGDQQRRIGILEALPTQAQFDIKVVGDSLLVTTGDGQFIFAIPSDLNGWRLVDAQAFVTTVSTSLRPIIQIRNVTRVIDMLSVRIRIDVGEFTSYTSFTPSVISLSNSYVATGDLLSVDIDASGTGAQGLGVMLTFGI